MRRRSKVRWAQREARLLGLGLPGIEMSSWALRSSLCLSHRPPAPPAVHQHARWRRCSCLNLKGDKGHRYKLSRYSRHQALSLHIFPLAPSLRGCHRQNQDQRFRAGERFYKLTTKALEREGAFLRSLVVNGRKEAGLHVCCLICFLSAAMAQDGPRCLTRTEVEGFADQNNAVFCSQCLPLNAIVEA